MRELTFLAFSFSTLFVCLFFSAEPASCKSQERAAVRCAATARPRCMAPRLQAPAAGLSPASAGGNSLKCKSHLLSPWEPWLGFPAL